MFREEDEKFQIVWSENDSLKRLHLSTILNKIMSHSET